MLLIHHMNSLPDYTMFRTGLTLLITIIIYRNIITSKFWLGTGKRRRDIDVKQHQRFLGQRSSSIISLHALTGTDETGKFSGWCDCRRFVWEYGPIYLLLICHTLHFHRFLKETVPESLPPTNDALKQHILWANFVANIWKNASNPNHLLLDPTKHGWKLDLYKQELSSDSDTNDEDDEDSVLDFEWLF